MGMDYNLTEAYQRFDLQSGCTEEEAKQAWIFEVLRWHPVMKAGDAQAARFLKNSRECYRLVLADIRSTQPTPSPPVRPALPPADFQCDFCGTALPDPSLLGGLSATCPFCALLEQGKQKGYLTYDQTREYFGFNQGEMLMFFFSLLYDAGVMMIEEMDHFTSFEWWRIREGGEFHFTCPKCRTKTEYERYDESEIRECASCKYLIAIADIQHLLNVIEPSRWRGIREEEEEEKRQKEEQERRRVQMQKRHPNKTQQQTCPFCLSQMPIAPYPCAGIFVCPKCREKWAWSISVPNLLVSYIDGK